jgi:hypothetical protein
LLQRAKFLCGCFKFEALKMDLAPQHEGDLLIPLGPRVQITKYLNLVVLVQRAKFLCGCFEFEALKVDLAPQHVDDLLTPKGPLVPTGNKPYLGCVV